MSRSTDDLDLDVNLVWFVCKFCGRSSTKKDVIQIHEYEFHIKTEKDLRKLKPNPSFMVKKNPKIQMECNQYRELPNSSMSSNMSMSLVPVTVNYYGGNSTKPQLQFRIEDFQVKAEMAQSLRKCFIQDCISTNNKSTVQSSASIKIETKVSKNNMNSTNNNYNYKNSHTTMMSSSGQSKSNVKIQTQSSSNSAILIKTSPKFEEQHDDDENKKEEEDEDWSINLEKAKSVKRIKRRAKKKSNNSAKCKICNKVFSHASYLYVHNRVHQKKKLACSICSFSSFYGTALKRHLRIHERNQHSK